jgi:hypothetical protein
METALLRLKSSTTKVSLRHPVLTGRQRRLQVLRRLVTCLPTARHHHQQQQHVVFVVKGLG